MYFLLSLPIFPFNSRGIAKYCKCAIIIAVIIGIPTVTKKRIHDWEKNPKILERTACSFFKP